MQNIVVVELALLGKSDFTLGFPNLELIIKPNLISFQFRISQPHFFWPRPFVDDASIQCFVKRLVIVDETNEIALTVRNGNMHIYILYQRYEAKYTLKDSFLEEKRTVFSLFVMGKPVFGKFIKN